MPSENNQAATASTPVAAKGPVFVQKAVLGKTRYTLMVGRADGVWQMVVAREDETIFGPATCASDAEGRLIAHLVAFDDAGLKDHYCNGHCLPWECC